MKTFKQYFKESNEYTTINTILQRYINGNVPDDYENEQQNIKELFKQIVNVLSDNGIELQLMKDGKPFDGSGIVINTTEPFHIELEANTKEKHKLHVEIKKSDNGDYFFSSLKVEK